MNSIFNNWIDAIALFHVHYVWRLFFLQHFDIARNPDNEKKVDISYNKDTINFKGILYV